MKQQLTIYTISKEFGSDGCKKLLHNYNTDVADITVILKEIGSEGL